MEEDREICWDRSRGLKIEVSTDKELTEVRKVAQCENGRKEEQIADGGVEYMWWLSLKIHFQIWRRQGLRGQGGGDHFVLGRVTEWYEKSHTEKRERQKQR